MSKKNGSWKLKFKNKSIEYKVVNISFLFFLISSILLLVIKFIVGTDLSFLFGFLLGYSFAIFGFWLLIISINWTIKYKSAFLYMILFLFRMLIYGIPILIYRFFFYDFNIFLIVFGFSIIWIADIIVNLLYNNDNKNEKIISKIPVKL